MTLSEKELTLISNPDKWVKVDSSNLEALLFCQSEKDKRFGRLFVQFKGNKTYFYEEVPKAKYKSMIKAESKGKFLNEHIIPNYACYRVNI